MNSVLLPKSEDFALRIIKLYKFLALQKREFVIAKQILRSGTSIGANIAEANYAQTRPDFITKMTIALKEANETAYWLRLLKRADYLSDRQFKSIYTDVTELLKMLTSTVKTARGGL